MAANPFMMDDPTPVGGSSSTSSNPFGNPFFDVSVPAAPSGASNPFLMTSDEDAMVSNTHSGSAIYNPFAAPVDPSSGVGDGLAWLSSGGAMQLTDTSVSPYDLPDSSLKQPHSMDDLLEEDIPLPDELVSGGTVEVVTPSPQSSPIPSSNKPERPTPPPRPPSRPSPPHETQQLILSVTGAMQVR